MADAVRVHDLRATELKVGRVHLAAEHLVERAGARQDDRVALVLDVALAEASKVRANADGAARHERDRENVRVGERRLAGNQARALKVFNAEAVGGADNVGDLVALLAIVKDLLRLDGRLAALVEELVVVGSDIQVTEA